MKRLLFFVAFMSLGTLALIQLIVRAPSGPPAAARQERQAANVLNMDRVTVTQLVGEQTRWELLAQHATFDQNHNNGRLQEVQFQVFELQPDGSAVPTIRGHSAEALVSGQPGSVVLAGRVVLSKGSTVEIHSERVEYDATKQTVVSPGFARVQTPNGIQEGASLRYRLSDEVMEFQNPVFYQ